MIPSTSSHAMSATMATAALVVAMAAARVKLDDTTLGAAVMLVNGIAMAVHPFVMAVGSRLLGWLTPTPQAAPVAPAPAPVPPVAPPA